MGVPRGRPSKVAPDKIIALILKYGEQILLPNQKIITKSDQVWTVMSRELTDDITPASLYAIVTCNRYGIRDKLQQDNPANAGNDVSKSDSLHSDGAIDDSLEEQDLDKLEVLLPIPRAEFEPLVVDRLYKRSSKRGQQGYRERKVLKPGEWQHMVTTNIWDQTQLKCGFHFKNHYLSGSGTSGSIHGKCKCGSELTIKIEDPDPKHKNIYLNCTIIKGLGTICGKLYLRAPIRQKVARDLMHKAVHVYQAEQADKLMSVGDPEPPHLFTTKVLSTAKHEYISSQYLDQDPIKAIAIMKTTGFQNIVHNIGLDPFYVHYWTNYQTQTYKANRNSCVSIDATGSIIKKIDKPGNTHCKPIFLYQCVINCPEGQYSIAQQITESHHANAIQFWLTEWVRSGAPIPREVVTDASRALMTGVIRAFTNWGTIEEYANACGNDNLPACYVRMDVAHFIKTYASFLKSTPHRIKIFYLAAIGKLVVTRCLDEARIIVKNILLVSRCDTDGTLSCGSISPCETAKIQLKALITGVSVEIQKDTELRRPDVHNVCMSNLVEGMIVECNQSTDDPADNEIDENEVEYANEGYGENQWSVWTANIEKEVEVAAKQVGDRENAHYLPKLRDRLVKDLKLIPLWSNILRDKFGYGRIPASSAPVEGEFNKIKSLLLKHCTTPMRADVFVEKHIDYINGRIKIANAKQPVNTDTSEQTASVSCLEDNREVDNLGDFELSPASKVTRESALKSADLGNPTTEGNPCPACAMFGKPPGGHLCDICDEPVHAISPCSIAIGSEEGYGTRRRCMKCHRDKSTPQIIATRERETWRGEGIQETRTEKRKARYLGARSNEIQDKLTFEKNRNLPIIKAGDTNTLQAVTIENEKVCFYNTCGFDSLFQLMLVLVSDWPTLRQNAEKLKDISPFIAMVLDTLVKGLRTHSYQLRAKILIEWFKKDSNTFVAGCRLINCEINVGWLAGILLTEMPSLVETSKCNRGCPPRVKKLTKLIIDTATLQNENAFQDVLRTKLQADSTKCCNPKNLSCKGIESTTVDEIGGLVVLDVADFGDSSDHINLKKLPKRLHNPLSANETFELVEFVHYKGASITTRRSGDGIGHYTAVTRRSSGAWLQYDDMCATSKKITDSFIANPKVMMFKRVTDKQ